MISEVSVLFCFFVTILVSAEFCVVCFGFLAFVVFLSVGFQSLWIVSVSIAGF